MEKAKSKKVGGTEETQHKGQQVLDPTHDNWKQMDLELQRIKAEAEKDLMQSSAVMPNVDQTTLGFSLDLLCSSIRKLRCFLMSGLTFTDSIDVTLLRDPLEILRSVFEEDLRHIQMSGSETTHYMNPTPLQASLQLLRSRLEDLREILMSDLTIKCYMDPTTLQDSLQLLDSSLENLNEILILGLSSSFPSSTMKHFMDHSTLESSFHLLSSSLENLGKMLMSEICHNEGRENLYHTESWKMEDSLQNFTQLLLLPKPCPRSWKTLTRKSLHETKGEERRYLIEIQDLFNPNPDTQEEPQLVILEGAAGIGKSTLARQVRRAWGEGQLYRDRFQHVFYLSCRELDQCKQLSLAELIAKDQAVPTAPIRQILSHPEKLLFILDGIDEPAWVLEEKNPELCLHWRQPQPVHTLLGSLLGKSVLPGASLLLTARTTDLKKLVPSFRQPCLVEVLGFSKSGRKKYIYKYFTEQRDATTVFRLVEANPVLSTLCVVPWVSWLVCTCLKQQMEQGQDLSLTSQTTTTLCLKYLSLTLPGLALRTQLRRLCSLAAKGIWRRRTLFSERDLQIQGLDNDVITTFLKIGVLQKQPRSLCYSFAHLCLQEFFAAMSCILCFNENTRDRIEFYSIVQTLKEGYGSHDLFAAPTMHFLFGLLSEKGMRKMQKIFAYRLPWETKLYLQSYILEETQHHQSYSLGLLHCLYEMQNEEVLKKVMHNYQGTSVHTPVDMVHPVFQTGVKYMVVQTDVDLMVVTFCIKFCRRVKRLQMNAGGQQRKISKAHRIVL